MFWGWAGGLWGRSWVLVRPCWTRGTVGSPGENGHGRQPTCGQWRVTWRSGDSERVDPGASLTLTEALVLKPFGTACAGAT